MMLVPENFAEMALDQMQIVLREALEGSPSNGSYFTDPGPGGGLLPTLAKLTAEQASRPLAGTSIAAHAGHVMFALEASIAWISGDRAPRDWRQSWLTNTVDDETWQSLQREIRRRYELAQTAVQRESVNSAEAFGGSLGLIAHIAYHLGAIKQKVALVN